MTHPGQTAAGSVPVGEPAAEPAAAQATELADRLAAAAQRLAALAELPVTEHVVGYEALHGELQDALITIDSL